MENNNKVNRRGLFRSGAQFFEKIAGEFIAAAEDEQDGGQIGDIYRVDPKRDLLYPPGAGNARKFNSLCTKCDDCIKACPEGVLFHAPSSSGEESGLPVFDPARKACFLCLDLYCIAACKEGALVMPENISFLKIGRARIDPARCLAQTGGDCSVCFDFCPLQGDAINKLGGIPVIEASRCVGCGLCEYYCKEKTGANAIATIPIQG